MENSHEPIVLTRDELRELTGFMRSDAQARVLKQIGVAYLRRPNGSLIVYRETLYETKKVKQRLPQVLPSPPRRVPSRQKR